LQCGKQHRDQDADDRNDDQHFDKRESAFSCSPVSINGLREWLACKTGHVKSLAKDVLVKAKD